MGDESDEDDPQDVIGQQIYIGSTSDTQNAVPPTIQTLSPNGVSLNSSGYLELYGGSLTAGGADMNPSVCVNGVCAGPNGQQATAAGVTLSSVQVTGTDATGAELGDDHIQVSYTVDGNASSTGAHSITVVTTAAPSNAMILNVGDPTPVITASAISPQPWYAQNSPISVTITGQGFGTNPQLSVTGGGVTAAVPTGVSSDGTIMTASVTIAANRQGGYATVTVTSQGYGSSCGGGSCWVQAQPGQSATSNSEQVQVIAAAPPVPQIVFNGTNVANNGTPSCPGNVACVFVGQQIGLTAVVPNLPSGVTVQSYTWSQPDGTVVGGYTPSTATGTVQKFPAAQTGSCQTLSESCLMFYWVDQASSRTITLSYTLSAGAGNSATVTFNVGGPTSVSIAVAPSPLNPAAIQFGQSIIVGQGLVLAFGNGALMGGQQPGITLNASAVLPGGNQGQYSWTQLLATYNVHYVNSKSGGREACALDVSPELDGSYSAYVDTGPEYEDSPFVPLSDLTDSTNLYGEVETSFNATAYLMWMPNPASGCTAGAACNIIVPLATLSWTWTGDAINTLKNQPNGTTWMLTGCQSCSNNPLASTSSYPRWQTSTSTMKGLNCSVLN
jgi:hypothetical protein